VCSVFPPRVPPVFEVNSLVAFARVLASELALDALGPARGGEVRVERVPVLPLPPLGRLQPRLQRGALALARAPPRLRDRGLRRGDRPRRVLLRGREARAARLQRGVAEARVRAEPARVPPRQTRIQRRQRLERRATRGSRDAPAVDFQHRALADGQRVSHGAFRAQRLDGRVPRRAADAETLRDLREVRRARAVEERHVRVGRRGAPRPSAEPRRRNRDCGHRRGVGHGGSPRDASAVPPLRA